MLCRGPVCVVEDACGTAWPRHRVLQNRMQFSSPFLQAREEEQEVRRGQFPHLPREIWEKVFSQLSTRDIARSLGPSCIALHG